MYPAVNFNAPHFDREARFFEATRDLVTNPAALVDSPARVRRTVFLAPQMAPLGAGGNGGGVVHWDPRPPARLIPIPRCSRVNPARDPVYYTAHPNHVGSGMDYVVRGWQRPSYFGGTDPGMLAQLDSTGTYSQPYATRGVGTIRRSFTWMF